MNPEPSINRYHADASAVRSVILVPDPAGNFRKQRVVLAEPDVQAGAEPPTALSDEDRSARHEVAVVALDSEPLSVAVAAVSRAALAFLMRHECSCCLRLRPQRRAAFRPRALSL